MTQSKLFQEIWLERPHVSQVSGCLLVGKNHPQWHWQFSHLLSKGAFPKYKLNPENIWLLTVKEHTLVTEHPEQARKLDDWKEYFEEYDRLRQQYFHLRHGQ